MPFVQAKPKPTIGAQRAASARRSSKPFPQPLPSTANLNEISKRITLLQHQMCAFQEEMEGLVSDILDSIRMEFAHLHDQLRYNSPADLSKRSSKQAAG